MNISAYLKDIVLIINHILVILVLEGATTSSGFLASSWYLPVFQAGSENILIIKQDHITYALL